MSKNKQQRIKWPGYIAAAILLIALGSMSSDYYVFLRWAITVTAVYYAYYFGEQKDGRTYLFAGVAILFNPIIPFTFSKDTWSIFDLIAAGIFAFGTQEQTKSDYKIKQSRLDINTVMDTNQYANQLTKIMHEYGKVIEETSRDMTTKYPATVFPVSLLPASKSDIREALEEAMRQAEKNDDQQGLNAMATSLMMLDWFIADEDAYEKNRAILNNQKHAKALSDAKTKKKH